MLKQNRPPANQIEVIDASGPLRYGWILLVALTLLLGPGATLMRGQTYLQSVGSPTFSTKIPVENGYIDASNGHLHLDIPMASYPQRAGGQFIVALMYDSSYWTYAGSTTWQPTNVPFTTGLGGGWHLATPIVGSVNYTQTLTGNCDGIRNTNQWNWVNWTYTSPDGTFRSFPTVVTHAPADSCYALNDPNSQGWASDGSGFWMAVTGYSDPLVYSPDGSIVGSSAYKDSNGNSYGITDTIGRSTYSWVVNGNTITSTLSNAQGNTTKTYTITTATINAKTNFGQTGVTECTTSCTLTVVRSIKLPDNTTYSFQYDCDKTVDSTDCSSPTGQNAYYGLITNMTLPTGAQITYAWGPFTDSQGNHYQWINHRTTPDSSTGWSYTPTVWTTCGTGQINCQQTFSMLKPNGDETFYTFTLNGGAWASQVQYYNQTTPLLSTVNQCWEYVGTIVSGNCPISSPTTGAPATQVHKLLSSTILPTVTGSVSKTTQYSYDGYGNTTMIEENNYYTGYLPSNPDRTTCISYLNSTNYVNALILNRPSIVTLVDNWSSTPCNNPPVAHVVAQTVYSYDGSGLASATGKANHDDTNYSTSNTVRGNLTQVKRLVSGSTTYLTTSMTYDMTGQIKTSTDSKGNVTQYDYTDNFYTDPGDGQNPTPKSASPSTNAYLTTITYPTVNSITLTKKFGYFYGTGQIALSTDENNNTSYSHFYDNLNRPTSTALPNSEWTRFTYSSTETQVDAYTGTTNTSASTNCAVCRHDQTMLDGLGRVASNRLVNDPDRETYIDTAYDSNGRIASVSNPYRGSQNGVETPSYDGLDRVTQVKHADNNIAHTNYGANAGGGEFCFNSLGYPVLVVDESGKERQTWTDGFGRVIETDEPDSGGSLTVGTCYNYDLNNNLTLVTSMGLTQTQKPTYTYDLVSRVTSKSLPGSGTTNFYYTTSGGSLCSGDPTAVCRRTDARNTTTTYVYDALNRLTTKTYSDGTLTAYYYYDQSAPFGYSLSNYKGRMTSMGTNNGTSWIALSCLDYDTLGHVSHKRDEVVVGTNVITEDIYYTYNLDGSIASIKYPSGRTVTYTEGNAQRMTSAVDTASNINYVTSPTSPTVMYAPQGGPQNLIFGKTGTFNGISEIRAYNNRLEVTGIEATSSVSTPLNLSYSYVSGNNGNISQQTNNATNGRTQNYTYDPLNRLLTAQTQATSGGDCWGQSFGNNGPPPTLAADALANLFYATATQCSAPQPRFTMNTSNNDQFIGTGIGYDSDGDMTADTAYNYTYDAENRISTASGMAGGPYCYTYDVFGVRVMKSHASGGSCTGTVTVDMLYWRNIAGNTIAETDGTGSTTNSSYNEYVFFAGRRIGQSNPSSGNVYYYFVDHLGSTRVVTTATGTACYEVDYLPYGAENTPSGFSNTCSTRYRFTGYERDLETAAGTSAGNDYAFARYYNSRLGRFMSGDPLDGDITDPQTMNKYTYVRNNPLNSNDPTGLSGCGEYNYWCFPDAWGAGNGGTVITVQDWCGDGWGPAYACFIAPNPPRPPLSPSQVAAPAPKPSKKCTDALKVAGQNMSAVDRANAAWSTIEGAADANNIDPALLAAIGVRESGFQNLNEKDGAGVGVGVFQITVSTTSGVTAAQAGNLGWAANYAANMLSSNMDTLGAKFPNFSPAQLLQATAASYNFGTKNISGNPNTIDVGTAHGNYGSNVVQLMNCF